MKKTLAILLALMMFVSILTACGGEEAPPPDLNPPREQDKTPDKTPEPVKTPEPPPPDDGRTTISSAEWGNISFIVPDTGEYELLLAEPGQDSLELFERNVHGQSLEEAIHRMTYQKAFITGDGFDILIGYKDLVADDYNFYQTYGMTENYWSRADKVTYDGLEGFAQMRYFYILAFPAVTQYGLRLIHIFPHLPEGADSFGRGEMEELAKELVDLPEIHVILDSLEFSGEMINEPRFELQSSKGDLVTVTPTDGWELSKRDNGVTAWALKKEGIGNGNFGRTYGEITVFTLSAGRTLKELIESRERSSSFRDMVQLDNIMINNQEFLVFSVPGLSTRFTFLTSKEIGVLDLDMAGYIEIEIFYVDDYNDALPMLKSITINP